jgi:hypothetical protein
MELGSELKETEREAFVPAARYQDFIGKVVYLDKNE